MGIGFEMNGMDELKKNVDKIQENFNNIKKNPTPEELLNDEFVGKYTKYNSLQEMYEKSGFDIKTEEDFAAIPDDEWDEFINKNTNFSNWEQMVVKAQEEYYINQVNNAIDDI